MAANMHQKDEPQLLRRAFDAVYNFRWTEVQRKVGASRRRFDLRIVGLILTLLGSLFLLWAVLGVLRASGEYVAWANSPPISERVVAPFEIEVRLAPSLDVTASQLLPPKVGNLEIGSIGSLSLLNHCLVSLTSASSARCPANQYAIDVTSAGYSRQIDEYTKEWVNVVAAQFRSDMDARSALRDLHNYSRRIGRIGNYAFLDSLFVNYYYSSTRDRFSFTWSNGSWVFNASGSHINVLNEFLRVFPY